MTKEYFSWSYSHISKFETCPKQYYHTMVAKRGSKDRVDEPETENQQWGQRVHEAFEDRIMLGKEFPKGMGRFEKFMPFVEKLPGHADAEVKMALNSKLKPVGYMEWGRVWMRAVADVLTISGDRAWAYDWKTGKRREDKTQLMIQALGVFHTHPDVERVTGVFIWLKEPANPLTVENFHRKDIRDYWKNILPRVNAIKAAKENDDFPAKPSGLCRKWCPVLQCPHNGRRK